MHQKIPLDSEREERGRLISGSMLGLVSWPLSWAAFISGKDGGDGGGFEFEKNFKRYR